MFSELPLSVWALHWFGGRPDLPKITLGFSLVIDASTDPDLRELSGVRSRMKPMSQQVVNMQGVEGSG